MATLFESTFVNAIKTGSDINNNNNNNNNNISNNNTNNNNIKSSNSNIAATTNPGKTNAANNNDNNNSSNIVTIIKEATATESSPSPSPSSSVLPARVSKFFNNNINYQSKIQQLISFSFTSSNFIFITFILSISKFYTTAASDAGQTNAPSTNVSVSSGVGGGGDGGGAAAGTVGSNFLLPNISGSMLLEKLNAFRVTTLGPPAVVPEGKAVSKSSNGPNRITNNGSGNRHGNGRGNDRSNGHGNRKGNSNRRYGKGSYGAFGRDNTVLGNNKGVVNIKFKYLNVSGKIGTSLDVAQYQYKKCEEKQFQCNNGFCIPIRFVCDGDPDCDDHSDEMIPECRNFERK